MLGHGLVLVRLAEHMRTHRRIDLAALRADFSCAERPRADEVITAVDGNVTQEFSKDTKAYAGTSYSLYKYDYLTATERDDVTT